MLIYGKEIREELKEKVRQIARVQTMCLAVIIVGEDPASQSYVNGIRRFADDTGVECKVLELSGSISQETLIHKIMELNRDTKITGIMLQTPLPDHMVQDEVVQAIDPDKDVEGIHARNLGRLVSRNALVQPCTPKAVMRMLRSNGIELRGSRVTVIGRSTIVGTPMALMLMDEDATVTLCHSQTRSLKESVYNADIVVAAAGKKHLVTADMVDENMIIMDVGTNFDEHGKMYGDVSPEAKEKAKLASAVPGGVGVITVAELFDNLCILAAKE